MTPEEAEKAIEFKEAIFSFTLRADDPRIDALPDVRKWLKRCEFLIKRKLAADLADFEAGDVMDALGRMMREKEAAR